MYAFVTRTVHSYPIMLSRILDLYSVQEIGNTSETRTETTEKNLNSYNPFSSKMEGINFYPQDFPCEIVSW